MHAGAAAGQTQRQIAAELGVARSTLQGWADPAAPADAALPAPVLEVLQTAVGVRWLHQVVVRGLNPDAVIIANAVSLDQVPLIYAAGANYVYMSRFEAASALDEAVHEALNDRIDVFREKSAKKNYYTGDRSEVLK